MPDHGITQRVPLREGHQRYTTSSGNRPLRRVGGSRGVWLPTRPGETGESPPAQVAEVPSANPDLPGGSVMRLPSYRQANTCQVNS